MTKAQRHNKGKPKLTLVLEATEAMNGAARVLEAGLPIYSRGNWLKPGMPHTEIADSALRHLQEWLAGVDYDHTIDPPQRHVDMFLTNAIFLAHKTRTHPEDDDRAE